MNRFGSFALLILLLLAMVIPAPAASQSLRVVDTHDLFGVDSLVPGAAQKTWLSRIRYLDDGKTGDIRVTWQKINGSFPPYANVAYLSFGYQIATFPDSLASWRWIELDTVLHGTGSASFTFQMNAFEELIAPVLAYQIKVYQGDGQGDNVYYVTVFEYADRRRR